MFPRTETIGQNKTRKLGWAPLSSHSAVSEVVRRLLVEVFTTFICRGPIFYLVVRLCITWTVRLVLERGILRRLPGTWHPSIVQATFRAPN